MLIGSNGLMLLLSAAVVDNAAFAFTPSHHHRFRSKINTASFSRHPVNVASSMIMMQNHRAGDVAVQGSSSRLHSSLQSNDALQSNDDDLDKLTIPALKEHLKQLGRVLLTSRINMTYFRRNDKTIR